MAQRKTYTVRRNHSRLRQQARRVGIEVDLPEPQLTETEQEETDIM